MYFFLAQARFPAPEFENYNLPELVLESALFDTSLLRVAGIVLFMLLSGLFFYRLRSRKALLLLHLLGLIIFGYLFTACPCPVGILQNITEGAASGSALPLTYVLLFTLPLLCAMFFGRLFCAGACPLGALQELTPGKKITVPAGLDQFLRLLPVLVLLFSVVAAAAGVGFPLCKFEPYLPLFLLSFAHPFIWLSVFFLLLGIVVSRPFCRYICPYGVLLRLFSFLAWKKPVITTEQCIACRICEQGCPNNAIIAPEKADTPALRQQGLRRVSLLLAGLPLALALGGFFGYAAAPLMLPLHSAISLQQELQNQEQTLAVEAYEKSSLTPAELEFKADRARNIISIGLTLSGVLFAACVMAELLAQARRREEEKIYRIDNSLCLCCGRCYQVCPLEKKRLARKGAKV